jgi:glyceraldehyde 3-phosphate dehydrogenase
MSLRVAINGFGRMGRLFLRAALDRPEMDGFEVVAVNETKGGPKTAAHLLEFDTVHGRWPHDIGADAETIRVDGRRLIFSEAESPSNVPWTGADVDIVLECSGQFRTSESLQSYFEKGVRKVIVSSPVKDENALNIVMGVNDDLYDPGKHHLVTAASCTTNCLAPVVKVVHEALGIARGAITTIHNATNSQVVVDAPHKDLRRARSALNALIPTTTGSATAIALIYPALKGKLNGHAVRVPLLNGSLTDCVFDVMRPTSVEEVNGLLKAAAGGALNGILGFEERPLVSTDFVDDPRSSIIDGPSTMVVNDTMVKIFAWYDNEWGYVNRMAEVTAMVAGSLSAQSA